MQVVIRESLPEVLTRTVWLQRSGVFARIEIAQIEKLVRDHGMTFLQTWDGILAREVEHVFRVLN